LIFENQALVFKNQTLIFENQSLIFPKTPLEWDNIGSKRLTPRFGST